MSDSSDPTAGFPSDPRWRATVCARCGARFGCGALAEPSAAPCWCTRLPPLSRDRIDATGLGGCLCPACLGALTAAR